MDKAVYKRRMNITEIRLRNARQIARDVGGQSALAKLLGKSESQISQIIGKKPVRGIGAQQARELEKAGGRPRDWLDRDHTPRSISDNRAEYALPTTALGKPLSETEERILLMWRGWSPVIKQYVFGQMRLADLTQDVIVEAFHIQKNRLTHKAVDSEVISSTTTNGEFIRRDK